MPFCPKCRYEYLPSVKNCPECGEPLVAELPVERQDAPIDDPLVAVYEAPDEVMSIMVRDLLEDAHIPVAVQSGLSPLAFDSVPLNMHSGYHSRLLVFESQADAARAVIAEYLAEVEAGALQLEGDEEEERKNDL